MSALAVVFPGQGSQKRGMGEDFVRECPEAASVFEEASDALGFDVKALCFADDPRLHLTEFTQPAILTTEIAMYRAVVARWGLEATHFGGHSLGEYSALVAAGAIPLAQAVCLVRFRGRLMQEVVPVGRGAMLAVMAKKLNPRFLRDVIGVLRVDLANWNSTNQIVLSGPAEDIETVHERMRRLMDEPDFGPGFLIKPLAVSAPFHSWMMAPMEWEFRKRVEELLGDWDCGAARKPGVTCLTMFRKCGCVHQQ